MSLLQSDQRAFIVAYKMLLFLYNGVPIILDIVSNYGNKSAVVFICYIVIHIVYSKT